MDNCPYCKGTKHILKESDGIKKLVRCRCLIQSNYARKLQKFNINSDLINYLIDEDGFRFSEDPDGVAAKKFYEIYKQRRSPRKTVVLNCMISLSRVQSIMAMLVAAVPEKDIQVCDLSDFINASFDNKKIQLKPVNLVTTLYTSSKQLKGKFVQDLSLQAKLENKELLFITDDFQSLKNELPELALFFSRENVLVEPEI